ncbi:MAG: hypothetical protein U0U46_04060 [Saprospiraceae bacterium]
MQVDIAAHIERLLFLHDTLVIPGFGGFTATRSPASADYSGGTVTPPTKTLSFNENLTVDDGILVNDIAQVHQLSLDEARRVVQDFVERTQALLNQREIVNLTGVGRLYKNYVQKIQFLPDAANFSADAYGLPPLQFSPIGRSREVFEPGSAPSAPAETTAPPPVSTPAPAVPSLPTSAPERPSVKRRSPALVGLLGALLIIASAAGAYWWLEKKRHAAEPSAEEQPVVDKTNPDAKKLENVAPARAEQTTETTTAAEQPAPTTTIEKSAEQSAEQKMEEARKQAAGNTGRRCILIVATLQSQENVDKLVAKLRANNLTPYHLKTAKGHQVGIEFRYTKAQDITDYSAVLQQLTGVNDVWVKQK